MTKEEKVNVLTSAENRAFSALAAADPAGQEYNFILNNIGMVRQIREMVTYGNLPDEEAIEQGDTQEKWPEPIKEATPVEEPVPAEVPAPAEPVVEDAEEDIPALTKEDVKARLITLVQKGVKLDAIFAQMGCANLSAVPAERYGELLALAEKEAG